MIKPTKPPIATELTGTPAQLGKMLQEICGWCKHADKCEIRKGLQVRTAMQIGIAGVVEVATIKEIVDVCRNYECLFPLKREQKK